MTLPDLSSTAPIRLVGTDLDGTLLRSDNTVSPRTREALARAREAGLPVVMVTGRPPRWLPEVAEATGLSGVAVAANGALLYDLDSERIVSRHDIEPALLATLTEVLLDAFPKVRFGVEYGLEFGYEAEYRHDWDIEPSTDRLGRPLPASRRRELAELITRPAVKLLAKNPDEDADQFLHEAAALIANLASVTRSGTSALLEIAAPGVTKASGLGTIAEQHGIDVADVAVVGDMPNDIPMLQWAGHSFAVANAHTDAAAAAHHMLVSNDEDAVATLIEAILDR